MLILIGNGRDIEHHFALYDVAYGNFMQWTETQCGH